MPEPTPLADRAGGVLLAGGQSRRFGAEKATAPFAGGVMMDAVLRRFAPLNQCAVSARAGSAAAAHARDLGLTVLHDAPGAPAGPLAGVAAGLAWANSLGLSVLATAPCDAPLLPTDIFSTLIQALADAPAAFATTEHGDHPLCAVWRTALEDGVCAALDGGRHPPVRGLLLELGARGVYFGDADAFTNVNTASTLAALERAA